MSRFIVPAVRSLFGFMFVVFGLNGFFHFIPQPGVPSVPAMHFLEALMNTGYLIQWVKGTEVLVGVLLLSNRFVPLALTLLAPIMLNIVAYHLLLDDPAKSPIALVLVGMHLFLAWAYRAAFKPMLRASTAPAQVFTDAAALPQPVVRA